ncbi:hypothetical protein [Rickettsiella endosymbiont of Aleochara curtula]|uniref:hypothetical protein n=1 Tax=Rickettsiella endosymbiont of Aleochara curtula TaxID=3077936 RepID=UPI00313AE45C
MATAKAFLKNNLENTDSTPEFASILVAFTHSMLSAISNLLKPYWFKAIRFLLIFTLGLFVDLSKNTVFLLKQI